MKLFVYYFICTSFIPFLPLPIHVFPSDLLFCCMIPSSLFGHFHAFALPKCPPCCSKMVDVKSGVACPQKKSSPASRREYDHRNVPSSRGRPYITSISTASTLHEKNRIPILIKNFSSRNRTSTPFSKNPPYLSVSVSIAPTTFIPPTPLFSKSSKNFKMRTTTLTLFLNYKICI